MSIITFLHFLWYSSEVTQCVAAAVFFPWRNKLKRNLYSQIIIINNIVPVQYPSNIELICQK